MNNNKEDRVWRPFAEARSFVQTLGLKNKAEWQAYGKSGKRPHDIPSNPDKVYASEFRGYGDWLGTGTVASFNRRYRSFGEARAFVRALGLKNFAEWRSYCKSGKKPADIPTMPERYGSDFKGYGDWLGTDNVAPTKHVFRPFAEARAYVRSLKLKNQDAWLAYCRSGQRPTDIPSNPDVVYLRDFVSFGDWLGNDNVSTWKRAYRPFLEARAFVHTLGLENYAQWRVYCASGQKPDDIPSQPQTVYRSEYKDMGDWLGTGRTRHYRSFVEARDFVRALGLQSYKQWTEYCQSGNKPPDIPSDPRRAYRSEYRNIAVWLGIEYLPFREAREFVRTLGLNDHDDWLRYCRSGKKPRNIPSKPMQVYRQEYKGMKDWLGVIDKWSSDSLKRFLRDLRPRLAHIDKKELVDILEREGALRAMRKALGAATPRRVLNDLLNNEGRGLEQALLASPDGRSPAGAEMLPAEQNRFVDGKVQNLGGGASNGNPSGRHSKLLEIQAVTSASTLSTTGRGDFEQGAMQQTQRGEQERKEEPPLDAENLAEQVRELLLIAFDTLYTTGNAQRRGYQLQDLLNTLFQLRGLDVQKSFTRNEGGEQIDGAFSLKGWYYLVECRWREQLTDIRQIDGLYGQVDRSGRQTMGLFLSIKGWSKNVCPLLKQNTRKSIILMDGVDLRGVLSGQADLQDFLEAKLAGLNYQGEPFLGLSQYLDLKKRK